MFSVILFLIIIDTGQLQNYTAFLINSHLQGQVKNLPPAKNYWRLLTYAAFALRVDALYSDFFFKPNACTWSEFLPNSISDRAD